MWIKKLARSTVTVINQASRVVGIIAIVFLLAMMGVTVLDVFMRFCFRAPIMGSLELVKYFMVVAGFFGLAWCAVKRGHVKVDMVVNRLPPRLQAIIESINFIFALTVVPLVAWQGFVQTRDTQVEKAASDFLGIPDYPFYAVFGIGFSLLFLVVVTLLAESIGKAIKRQ